MPIGEKKKEHQPLSPVYIEFNLRWIVDLNIKVTIIKLLKENLEYLHDLNVGKNLLGRSRKH